MKLLSRVLRPLYYCRLCLVLLRGSLLALLAVAPSAGSKARRKTENNNIMVAALAFLFCLSTGAQTPSPTKDFAKANPEDITNENFPDMIESFDYPNADISEVVKAISKLTKKNFILDQNVRGKISIIAPSPITVAEAYRAFLSALAMNNLTIVPSGNFLKIRQTRAAQRDSIETYAGEFYPNTDQLITRIIKLKYISAEEVHKSLRLLNSKDGEMYPYGPTNSIIITDYGSNIERVMGILSNLDVPGFEEQLAVIPIKYATSKNIADLIDQIINKGDRSSGGRFGSTVPRFRRTTDGTSQSGSGAESYSLVISDDRTNSVIVVGNQAGIAKIRKLIQRLDFQLRPEDAGGVYVYYVRYGEATEIANVLNGIAQEAKNAQKGAGAAASPAPIRPMGAPGEVPFSNAIFGGDVKVTADKVTNSLIISAGKQDYETIKNLLEKIDIARDQVYVKTVIMEMNAEKSTSYSLSYYKFDKASNGVGRVGFSSGDLSSILNPQQDMGGVLSFGSGSEVTISPPGGGGSIKVLDLVGFIKFLKVNAGGNILSQPQVMALDNEEALIEVGQKVPIGTTVSQIGNSTSTASSTQFDDATIKLKITPFISPESDNIRLKINQQIKSLATTVASAKALADTASVLNTRAIETVISVDSGNTAVIGGLMNDQETVEEKKVPILGDIPILGWLFKSNSKKKTKFNLVVFITPQIIRNRAHNERILDQKLSERIEFIKNYMKGEDPHGKMIDALPRLRSEAAPEAEPAPEEPATETF